MNEPTTAVRPQPSQAPDDLWFRLRESLLRLDAVREKKTDPEVLAEKFAARAEKLRGAMTTAEPAETPLVILGFKKGNQRYAVPVDNVIEVQSLDRFSPVPGTPPFITGVMHWRGDILSLLDIGKLFAIPESGIADTQVCLIVEAAGRRVAIVALETEEIYRVFKSDVWAAPELPGTAAAEWVIGVHAENRILLDLEAILQDPRLVNWRP